MTTRTGPRAKIRHPLARAKLDNRPALCKMNYMATKKTITEVLRRAIAHSGESFQGLEKETGVLRQSLMKFARGEQVLRGDAYDKLAAFFGLELKAKRKGR